MILLVLLTLVSSCTVQAQQAPQQSQASLVDPGLAVQLLWSTLLAIEHGNDTLNYSVLRDMAAPEFQQETSLAQISQLFAPLREARVDLSSTLLMKPVYEIAPQIRANGMLRMRGTFEMRPESVSFDLLYQQIYGQWRLLGVAIALGVEKEEPVAVEDDMRRFGKRR